MDLTLFQKIALGTLRYIINFLWFLDTLSFDGIAKPKKISIVIPDFLHVLPYSFLTVIIAISYGFSLSRISQFGFTKNFRLHDLAFYVMAPEYTELSDSSDILGVVSQKGFLPVFLDKTQMPFISAKSYIVVDRNTGSVLAAKNQNTRLAPASTTKLMTALVALDLYSIGDEVQMTSQCLEVPSTKIWLPAGETFYVKDLLHGLLISSAGDVACVLASTRVNPTEFVSLMNKRAAQLGMKDTNFTNAIGLDAAYKENYSTASDLYLLANAVVNEPILRKIVATKTYDFKAGKLDFKLTNTNRMLWDVPESVGIKTGTTTDAGQVLLYEYKNDDVDLIIVVMGSDDRFSDTKNLLAWTLENYSW